MADPTTPEKAAALCQQLADSCQQLTSSCPLQPGSKAQDFSAVAVKQEEGKSATNLFTLSSLHTDYVVLVYLPKLGSTEVAELLDLNKNAARFAEVR